MTKAHYHTNSQDRISEKLCGEGDVDPTYGFTASLEVGLGATVHTLQTGYHRVQASCQDKGQDMRPHAATCPAAPEPAYLLMEGFGATTCPRISDPPLHLGGLRHCHMS
jgi:hypothetical protein